MEENEKMKIQIINPSNKKPFDLIISLKEKDLKAEMNSIINYIVSLNNKISDLDKELKKGINRINILEEKVNDLMSIKSQYEKLKKEEIKNENRFFPKSNIINIEDENIIINWFDKKPIKFLQLFDSKVDGDSIASFHSKCSNKSPIFLIIKTSNGYKFGGFTSKIIAVNANYTNDNKAFLFSLDKKEKYNISMPQYATFYSINNFFQFGGCALRIYNNCMSNQNNYISNGGFETVPSNHGINFGEQYFRVSSFEVYQLEY